MKKLFYKIEQYITKKESILINLFQNGLFLLTVIPRLIRITKGISTSSCFIIFKASAHSGLVENRLFSLISNLYFIVFMNIFCSCIQSSLVIPAFMLDEFQCFF